MIIQALPRNPVSAPAKAWTEDAFAAFLANRGTLNSAALERITRLKHETGDRLCSIVVRLGLLSERLLADALAQFTDLSMMDANGFPPAPILADQLSPRFLRRSGVVPVAAGPDGVVLATADPLDDETIEAVRYAADAPVSCRIALQSDIAKALDRLYGDEGGSTNRIVARFDATAAATDTGDAERLKDLASEAPAIRLVNLWIDRAVEARASDIHIEPAENALRVRFRIDGALREAEQPPARLAAAIASRVKVMAGLNIAERRLPQDGKFRLAVRGREIDVRVSVIPTVHGEGIVLRILDKAQAALEFAGLGFDEPLLSRYRRILDRPHGILLVTGPTGSGKTTTLYASLMAIRRPDLKVLTIEDPIEYQLDGINQTQVHPQIGLTFASALRAFLRHDPDVMLVGEIRDTETARVAVQAALTGHLVLSTLHTNDAASAITRLQDMGVDDYLIASTVNGVAAQRLVRRLCPRCRAPAPVSPELRQRLQAELGTNETPVLHEPAGCDACEGRGYAGRTIIGEVLVMTEDVRRLTLRRAPADEIRRTAQADGMQSMYRHGLRKCQQGIATLGDVLRVTSDV